MKINSAHIAPRGNIVTARGGGVLDVVQLSKEHQKWCYNALDCCVTRELDDVLSPLLGQLQQNIYNFERCMLGPAICMSRRGILVDPSVRNDNIKKYTEDKHRIDLVMNKLSDASWGRSLNANSNKQLCELFYGAMKIPPILRRRKDGKRTPSCDRDALEQIQTYFFAMPVVSCILASRDCDKKLQVLFSGIDSDGRLRTSNNVGATESGRWSNSQNVYGTGTSFHTMTEELRRMMVPDRGKRLAYIDLKGAESVAVAYLIADACGDESYLKATQSGDTHTYVARMIWRNLPWTGDIKKDREISERQFYRWFTYRDMSKRGGHLSNYYGTEYTLKEKLKLELDIAKKFRSAYLSAFPGFQEGWWPKTQQQLRSKGHIITPLGRKRTFFGRLEDDATLREAIAYVPQSLVADILCVGLYRIWSELEVKDRVVECLAHVHDAVLIQYDEALESEVIPRCQELMKVPVQIGQRTMCLDTDAATGYNWAKQDERKKIFSDGNPCGLIDWKDYTSGRIKQERKEVPILDKSLPDLHARQGVA